MAINDGNNEKVHSIPHVQNMGFDRDNQLPIREIVGVDENNVIRRVPTNTDGSLIVTGGLIIPTHNHIALTYISTGNGFGEIETATYKTGGSGGTTVATLTLTYNSSNEIASVTRS